MHMKKGLQKKILGFTLVEIMIVVTIIGILASLAVPAFQRARWKALETSVRNNLRQIWGAAQQYMLENGVNSIAKATSSSGDGEGGESSAGTKATYGDIFAWVKKGGATSGVTNPGYTSVLQQIADEDYDTIFVYESDTIEMFTNDNNPNNDVESSTTITDDTQGLAVAAGDKWVKLRL